MPRFAVGDVVYRRSGGPRMTIEAIGDLQVDCVWFDGTEKQRGQLQADLLETWRERVVRLTVPWHPKAPAAAAMGESALSE